MKSVRCWPFLSHYILHPPVVVHRYISFPVSSPKPYLVTRVTFVVRVNLSQITGLVALARMCVTRSLTAEECSKYLHMEQCPPVL